MTSKEKAGLTPRPVGIEVRRLSRSEIVDAALAHLAESGLETLTVRKLAERLHVSPMALYRHVKGKDDILLAVVDVLLARQRVRPSDDGRAYLAALARALRRLLAQYPALVRIFNRQPVTTPAAKRRVGEAVEVLMKAGWSRREALQGYAAVHTYTLGFCTLEAARAGGEPAEVDTSDEAAAIRAFVTPAQFRSGLDALVSGLGPASARRGPV